MAGMTSKTIAATYKGLLKTAGDNVAVPTGSTGVRVVDGEENVTALYLTDGEVGIGTATPATQLEIAHATTPTFSLHREDVTMTSGESLGEIRFTGGDNSADGSTTATQTGAQIQAVAKDAWTNNDTPTELQFYTSPDGGTVAKRMTIDIDGKVGIGVADPAARCEINTGGDGWDSAEPALYVENLDSTNAQGCGILVKGGSNHADSYQIKSMDYSGNTDFIILGTGNVGIGIDIPAQQLHITSKFRIQEPSVTTAFADCYHLYDYLYLDIYGDAGSSGGLRVRTNDASLAAFSILPDGKVGIGTAVPVSTLGVEYSEAIVGFELHSTHETQTTNMVELFGDKPANANYTFMICQSNKDDSAVTEFSIDGTGAVVAQSYADYAEYFESSNGKDISLGTTVVLVDGKVRASKDGETPFGVVSKTPATNHWGNYWTGRFLKTEYNDFDLDQDGFRKENPDFDSNIDYKPRSDRDEWNSIGLLGQVPITKGQPVASSWIKMWEVSNSVDMYYIFPCAQIVNNNNQGDSNNEQEQDSSNNNGGDSSSESSGEDSGGVEGSSSDSSSTNESGTDSSESESSESSDSSD